MIVVTRLDGSEYAINPDLIERIVCQPGHHPAHGGRLDVHCRRVDGRGHRTDRPVPRLRPQARPGHARHDCSPASPALSVVPDGTPQPGCTGRAARPESNVMDPATIIGILLAFGSVVAHDHSGRLIVTLDPPAAADDPGLRRHPRRRLRRRHAQGRPSGVQGRRPGVQGQDGGPRADSIDQVVGLAEKARSEGLLALEAGSRRRRKDPFLRGALQNIADGTDGDELRIMLEDEIDSRRKADHTASKFFKSLGGYAPTDRHHRHRGVPDPRAGKPFRSRHARAR